MTWAITSDLGPIRHKLSRLAEGGFFESWAETAKETLVEAHRRAAPHRTGKLAGSITGHVVATPHRAEITIIAEVPYAKYVVGGAGPHEIQPVNAQALTIGNGNFSALVHHPGTTPNPFPRRAWDESRALVVAALLRSIREVLA